MAIKVTKPSVNLREKLNELDYAKVPFQKMPAGSVLQVVNATYNTFSSTLSTTYVDSGLTATITPSSASSKILVLGNLNGIWLASAASYLKTRVIRDTTGLTEFAGAAGYSASGGASAESTGTNQLDSPNTTSAVTYKIQVMTATGAQVAWCNNQSLSSITLMEIAQ